MENPRQDIVILQSFRVVSSVKLNARVSAESEQEQQSQPEYHTQRDEYQGPTKLKGGPPSLAQIELRMLKLHNRLLILLKSQEYRKKAKEKSNWITNEVTKEDNEDDGELCELEAIQREMMELQVMKEKLERNGTSCQLRVNGDHRERAAFVRDGPRRGIYTLPPVASDQGADAAPPRPTGSIVPVESLRRTAEVTQCPFCEEVVLTETHSTVGEAMWIMCILCSMLGCLAGCCLIPFRMKHLRNVSHRCPRCQAQIHIFRPF